MVDQEVVVELTDARAIRAIAHEARQQVINILYAEQQPLTATELAARTSLTPSAMSYHLRALERWGVVVRDEGGADDGRQRPWRAAGTQLHIRAGQGAADAGAADALYDAMMRDQWQRIRHLRDLPEPERDGYTSMSVTTFWLTPEEVAEVRDALDRLLQSYDDRQTPDGSRRRVAVSYSVLPVPEPGRS